MLWQGNNREGWRCARCSARNALEDVFCAYCGRHRPQQAAYTGEERMEAACPVCGEACPPGALFCPSCGAPLRKGPADEPVQRVVPLTPAQEEQVRCVHCGTMNPARNRFCEHCAQEVRVLAEEQETLRSVSEVCPACGARCVGAMDFCNACGVRLPDRGDSL